MAKGDLSELTTIQLKRRKRTSSILIVILIAASVLNVGLLLYDNIWGIGTETFLAAPAIMCVLLAIIMGQGLKKINKELAERNNA